MEIICTSVLFLANLEVWNSNSFFSKRFLRNVTSISLEKIITIIHKGKILKSDTKNNLINLIGKKIVKFNLNSHIEKLPSIFDQYNPIINEGILSLTYDKHITKLKSILEELSTNKIIFDEINTQESDLEDVFIELTRNSV